MCIRDRDRVQYSQSIDCFSFGVLAIQIITRKFPNPSSHLDKVTPPRRRLFSSQDPNEYMRVIQEVDRRQNHLSLISSKNPLREILIVCLSNKESARPLARDICRSLAAIKEGHPLYIESLEISSDYQPSMSKLCDATRDELQSTTDELQKTRSAVDDYRQDNETLQRKNRSLEQQINELSQKVQELEIQVLDTEQKHRVSMHSGTSLL